MPALKSYCTVTVDVIDTNNHAPSFLKATYTAEVEENMPEQTFVIQVVTIFILDI